MVLSSELSEPAGPGGAFNRVLPFIRSTTSFLKALLDYCFRDNMLRVFPNLELAILFENPVFGFLYCHGIRHREKDCENRK